MHVCVCMCAYVKVPYAASTKKKKKNWSRELMSKLEGEVAVRVYVLLYLY